MERQSDYWDFTAGVVTMEILVIYWIIFWSAILLLFCVSARAGAAERIQQDEKYSFKRLYQNLPDRVAEQKV